MSTDQPITPRSDAAGAFDKKYARSDGSRIVASLTAGLDTLSKLALDRVATDPEGQFGVDSMLMPAAIAKGHVSGYRELEMYQSVESEATVRARGYVATDDHWYLQWVARLRLSEMYDEAAVVARLAMYRAKPPDGRRMMLETALERALPQATHVPLVLFRLYPLAIEIVTAVAFGDSATAGAARKQQLAVLPSLADCHDCHGRLLDNGEECRQCGNPLWKFDWLTAD